jgi:hypothetical protein
MAQTLSASNNWIAIAIAILLMSCSAQPQLQQNYVNPQAAASAMLQRHLEEGARMEEQHRQEEATRMHYQGLSGDQIRAELNRYCPGSNASSCIQRPPDALVEEARHRGLIEPVPMPPQPRRPGVDCVVVQVAEDISSVDCQ